MANPTLTNEPTVIIHGTGNSNGGFNLEGVEVHSTKEQEPRQMQVTIDTGENLKMKGIKVRVIHDPHVSENPETFNPTSSGLLNYGNPEYINGALQGF